VIARLPSLRCAAALATLPLAAALGGCLDMMMEDAGPHYVLASPTEDPMDPEVRKTLPMVQQHGIYYEYPVWLDYKSGEEEWEAGYVWASLAYLPLIGNVSLYKDAPRDPVRFSDLVEGIEPLSIVYMRVIGMDGNQKPRWSSQFNLNDHAQVHRIGQLNMGNAQIPCDIAGLSRQRALSPAHAPLQVRLGDRDVWAIGDRPWFLDQWFDTVELYPANPASGSGVVRPAAVWITARSFKAGEWHTRDASLPYLFGDRAYSVAKCERRADGALVAFEAKPWPGPSAEDLLDGTDSETYFPARQAGGPSPAAQQFGEMRVRLETSFNEKLIEWKAVEMPKLLSGAKSEYLSKLSVRIEKALLKLDLKSKQLKDAADEDARQANPQVAGKAPPRALDRAHLLDQRKTILTVILGAVKRAGVGQAQ
jgi:hypothetical protein